MSKIEWTEKTWNPSIGCTKVSAGCKNCYAEVMAKRLQAMGNPEYRDGFTFKILKNRLAFPTTVKKPTIFFVNSMSDLFHERMPFSFLDAVFEVMKNTPQHRYQILTKREKTLAKYCQGKEIAKNIFLGVTVENKTAVSRINYLNKINGNKFLSIEPLLEDLGDIALQGIGWVIVGGESGANARPMKEEWVTNIYQQCKKQKVPFFFKQWGTWSREGERKNKKTNGRVFRNQVWNEMPEEMQLA